MERVRPCRAALIAVAFGVALIGCSDAIQRASDEPLPTSPLPASPLPASPVTHDTLFTVHPPHGQIRVAVETTIRAQTSEPLAASSIDNTAFTVDNGVTGTVDYDAANNMVRFAPSKPLDYGKTYTATLNVKNQDGTSAPVTWTFTTTPSEFTKRVAGVTAGVANDTFSSTPSYVRHQSLYVASEINGSGFVHQIAVRYAANIANAVTCPGVTIKLNSVGATALDTSFNANLNSNRGSPQVVLNNQSVTFPAGNAGDFFVIPFDNDFYYNGADNLVIETVRSGACSGSLQLRTASAASVRDLSTSSTAATLGTTANMLVDREFRFFGGDNRIAFPVTTQPAIEPFSNNSYDWHSYALYRIGDINGVGWINGLAFRVGTTTTQANSFTLQVDFGYTTNSQIVTGAVANNFASPPVTVANNIVFTVPAGTAAGSDLWVPLPDNTFFYNGTANLLLRLVVARPLAGTSPETTVFLETGEHPSGAIVRTRGPEDTYAEGSYTNVYNIKLRFAGGHVEHLVDSNALATHHEFPYPFTGDADQTQLLYRNTELGSKGTIQALSLRLSQTSTAETYNNFRVVLAHTALEQLLAPGTFTGNMFDPHEVFRGALSVPAGLLPGDWVRIPLTVPFYYNPNSHLVVYFSTTGGSAGVKNLLQIEDAAINYKRVVQISNATSSGPTSDFPFASLTPLRLEFK